MEYSPEQLEKAIIKQVKQGNSPAEADLFLLRIDDRKLILKDFSKKKRLWRCLIGKIAIAQEVKAYQRLIGVKGIPQFFSRPNAYSLVIEYIEGDRLPHRKERHKLPQDFFQKLAGLIDQMHRRGVAHGDLRKKNIFLSPTGEPYILDFATAICLREKSSWLKRMIFKKACLIDKISVEKLKANYFPFLNLQPPLSSLQTPFYLHLGRFIRKKIYRPIIKPKYWHQRWSIIRRLFIR